jgi:hypothetical protein
VGSGSEFSIWVYVIGSYLEGPHSEYAGIVHGGEILPSRVKCLVVLSFGFKI